MHAHFAKDTSYASFFFSGQPHEPNRHSPSKSGHLSADGIGHYLPVCHFSRDAAFYRGYSVFLEVLREEDETKKLNGAIGQILCLLLHLINN